jgi:hypothetical protein
MKLVAVEITFDNFKTIFYYTAEERVDFRQLVKELVSRFRTRIEMRQIGVRQEALMIGGVGACGRPYCCAGFLSSFNPVSVKMAKEQNISLNTVKISGVCGRLMCCLAFESMTSHSRLSPEEIDPDLDTLDLEDDPDSWPLDNRHPSWPDDNLNSELRDYDDPDDPASLEYQISSVDLTPMALAVAEITSEQAIVEVEIESASLEIGSELKSISLEGSVQLEDISQESSDPLEAVSQESSVPSEAASQSSAVLGLVKKPKLTKRAKLEARINAARMAQRMFDIRTVPYPSDDDEFLSSEDFDF